ncbi:MAG: hypothetical protein M3014_01940 [Chloroflexota bacterium]|nr:hypothetical protein [Chloroflexota bacterium]
MRRKPYAQPVSDPCIIAERDGARHVIDLHASGTGIVQQHLQAKAASQTF